MNESISEISIEFRLKDIRQEDGFDKKVYCIRFCEHIPSMWSYFATVGSNNISIYRMHHETEAIELVQHHVDEDYDRANSDSSETFYSCTWASDKHQSPVIVAAGKRRILKVVNLLTYEVGILKGHGDYINELRTHPIDEGLIFSASRDQSIRLWNIRSMTCVAVFGGEKGHRDDVLCIDVHMLGSCLASSSIDTSIKIWNLNDPDLTSNIEKSDKIDQYPDEFGRFKVVYIQIPLFSTNSIHTDYVDSIKWIGDNIISKSTNDRIVLWTPDSLRYKVTTIL
jgi:polycomb protein EED